MRHCSATAVPGFDLGQYLPGPLIHIKGPAPHFDMLGVMKTPELTLLIAERANRLAQRHPLKPGGELALWLEAEAEVKRELREERLLRIRVRRSTSLAKARSAAETSTR
jgi:hypothetical protein